MVWFKKLWSKFKKLDKQNRQTYNQKIKQDHDVAALMGSLGMSYSEYERYQEAVDKIREHEEKNNL